MTLARTVLLSALLTSCASGPKPPPTDTAALGPATWTPLPPASDAPFDTSRPPAEFWKLGQAACPEGASFSPAEAQWVVTRLAELLAWLAPPGADPSANAVD